ncbi:low molecular weight phosphatase family protein [Salegentibacter sp.]|uniref:arsenate-mycothiol transferase ArsC n=1 Tax=Salegentibacter sp. TaxID=1903072 RepID=UPI003562CD78
MLFSKIKDIIESLEPESIPDSRKAVLAPLIEYVEEKLRNKKPIDLNFICTHNSRRSHLSQIWAQVMGDYFNIERLSCYSGGTEATAMFPVVAVTLEEQGFEISPISEGKNPVYAIKYAPNSAPVIGFSKTYDHKFNPVSGFAAIMTCSQADAGCPFIPGAEKRIPITYDDPKEFDGTPKQAEKYWERSLQIATELFFVFSKINQHAST